jgi:choline dehydrogenase
LTVPLSPRPELSEALAELERRGKLYASQVSVKAASSGCDPGSCDLHLLPTAGEPLFGEPVPGVYEVGITAFLMKQASRGTVRITGTDPESPLAIEHRYLSDPDGADLQALADGIELACELAGTPELARLASIKARPGLADRSPAGLAAIRAMLGTYWHPVGSCAVGTDPETGAVVDGAGRVHGFDNLYVLDASVLPNTPRANTQLSVLAVAGMLAERLVGTLG